MMEAARTRRLSSAGYLRPVQRWFGGAASASVLAVLAGAQAWQRVAAAGRPAATDELRDEDFTLLDRDPVRRVVTEDGVPLSVRVVGSESADATVVFVHGFCNSMRSFHFQRRDLARLWGPRIRMVFFDLRGHGRSGLSGSDACTVPQLGRDLVRVIEQCAPTGPLILVGHSMGGMAIMAAAAQQPRLFDGRVVGTALLSTTAAEVTGAGVAQLLRSRVVDGFRMLVRTSPALVEAVRVSVRHLLTPVLHVGSFHGSVSPVLARFTTAMIDGTRIETVVAFLEALELHDESAALPVLGAGPVLVTGGGHDPIIAFRNARELAARLPDVELIRVGDGSHMTHLQYPELINDALDRLLVRAGVGPDVSGSEGREVCHG